MTLDEILAFDEAKWEAFLAAAPSEEELQDAAADMAVVHCLGAARQFNEILLGGDDSPFLVQVLMGSQDAQAEHDVLASVLLPEETVRVAHTVRGSCVPVLLKRMWRLRSSMPLVINHDEVYTGLWCRLAGEAEAWSSGLLTLDWVRHLQRSRDFTQDARLEVHVPGTSQPQYEAEMQRAAIERPRSLSIADSKTQAPST